MSQSIGVGSPQETQYNRPTAAKTTGPERKHASQRTAPSTTLPARLPDQRM
jgi:hypothetical protein